MCAPHLRDRFVVFVIPGDRDDGDIQHGVRGEEYVMRALAVGHFVGAMRTSAALFAAPVVRILETAMRLMSLAMLHFHCCCHSRDFMLISAQMHSQKQQLNLS